MTPAGNVDTASGIRQFTIGTGGEDLDALARDASGAFSNPTSSPARTTRSAS